MKLKVKIKIINKNILSKTLYVSLFSILVTLSFVIYNAYFGIKYVDAFSIGISIYYLLLIWVRSATLIFEKVISEKDDMIKSRLRIKNYKISSIFVFIIDICLIAPIILMVIEPKDVFFGIIPAIAMAAYSTYKIVIAIINYIKSKKSKNPTIILLREINIIDAIVSILTLQHTLIMVNGGMNDDMRTLSFVTSILLIVLIIGFSIFSYLKNKKLFNFNSVTKNH